MTKNGKEMVTANHGLQADPILQQIDSYVNELRQVENELQTQLSALGSQIDSSFGMMASTVALMGQIAMEATKGHVSDKTLRKIGMYTNLAVSGISAIGAGYSTYKHNQYLDKLMEQKQRLARTKHNSLRRIIPLAEKVNENLKKIIKQRATHMYKISDLEKINMDMLMKVQEKMLYSFKTSCYVLLVAHYLDKEYDAWENDEQTSGDERPTPYTNNCSVISFVADAAGENPVQAFLQALSPGVEQISGSTLFCLLDSSLVYTVLSASDNPLTLPSKETVHSVVQQLIDHNDWYDAYCSRKKRVNNLKFRSLGYLLAGIAVIVLWYFVPGWYDWATWLRWTVWPLGFLLWIFITWMVFGGSWEDYKTQRDKFVLSNMKDAGYIEYPEIDLEKHSVVGSVFNSLFSN